MIQGRPPAQRSSFSRGFLVVRHRRRAAIIESAGEPVLVFLCFLCVSASSSRLCVKLFSASSPRETLCVSVLGIFLVSRSIRAEGRRGTATGGDDPGGDLVGDLGVVAKILLGVFTSLAEPEIAVVEP
jgi:hypothetical protein